MNNGLLSKAFAHSTDEEQANVLNELARELYVICKGQAGFEWQLCGVSKKLSKDGISMIKMLHEFILLREKEMPL